MWCVATTEPNGKKEYLCFGNLKVSTCHKPSAQRIADLFHDSSVFVEEISCEQLDKELEESK